MKNIVSTIVILSVAMLGVFTMSDKDFNPLVLFFYLAGVISTSVVTGYWAEIIFDKIKEFKIRYEMG